jgi:hypothetical protein
MRCERSTSASLFAAPVFRMTTVSSSPNAPSSASADAPDAAAAHLYEATELVDSVSVDDGEPVVSHERGETQGYALRFLTGDIEGERLVKGVSRTGLLSLPADADPGRYETVTHEDPEYK